jgi:hypothetical protein
MTVGPHRRGRDRNPDLSYIWVEDGKLMEFRASTRPPRHGHCLCIGHGEVDQSLAEEFDGSGTRTKAP